MATTEIVFVRHGETQSNLDLLLHGRTDVPLTPLGKWQARRVAERVREIGPVDALYSSPLLRARTTAQFISSQIGLEATFLDDLTEFHFGDFEGYTLTRIQESHPEIFLQVIDTSDFEFRFPNGESRREFHARVKYALDSLAERSAGSRLVVVAHGGVIASAVAQFTDGDPNDWSKFLVHNCSITRLELGGQLPARLACWDDIAHLDNGGLSR
jgi:2,3-bisphosphoglycerate-dependent phosphoglycerate mutase